MEELNAKLDGLKELFGEKFDENKSDHQKVWLKVNETNGRLRMVEKFMYTVVGAIAILGILFSPSAVQAIINIIK